MLHFVAPVAARFEPPAAIDFFVTVALADINNPAWYCLFYTMSYGCCLGAQNGHLTAFANPPTLISTAFFGFVLLA
jgi:hypothetical protein